MAIIYFILTKTVGSEESFKRKAEVFMQQPDEIKKKANKILLIPFLILVVIVFGLAIMKL
jgi:hypothetical protein